MRRPRRNHSSVFKAKVALAAGYRALANEARALWPLSVHPNPPAPRLTRRLALLEAASGHPAPGDTLLASDILVITRRRLRG